METLNGNAYSDPFPHLIVNNFYNSQELELVWEELKFFTKPNKLLDANDYGGVVTHTNSHALILDDVYKNRKFSNILNVNRKLFTSDILKIFAKIHDCCSVAKDCNYDVTKVRYYHDGEYYEPHTDLSLIHI